MKAGLTTSVVLHVAALGFGLFTLSAPAPLDAGDMESFPVDIVPVSDFAQSVKGEKTASISEKPAPKPTERPDIVPEAQNVGDNKVDLSTPPTPKPATREVEQAATPPPSPEPTPKPVEEAKAEPAPAPEPAPKPEPVPATEAAPQPAPKQEVKPEPVPEPAVAEAAPVAESTPLPSTAPSPQARPQPPQAQTAKAPERKEPEKQKPQETAQKPKSEDKAFDADEVAMLLNKAAAQGGGAKRSSDTASLGGKKTTGEKLSASEMGALSNQLAGCWSIPAGAEGVEGLRVSVRFRLDPSGRLDGEPVIDASSGNTTFDRSAVRAVQKCNAEGLQVPQSKAEVWASGVVVNFDPSEMF